MKECSGFTMVEIMIVVVLIGMLAAIAVPSYVRARAQSRRRRPASIICARSAVQRTGGPSRTARQMALPCRIRTSFRTSLRNGPSAPGVVLIP